MNITPIIRYTDLQNYLCTSEIGNIARFVYDRVAYDKDENGQTVGVYLDSPYHIEAGTRAQDYDLVAYEVRDYEIVDRYRDRSGTSWLIYQTRDVESDERIHPSSNAVCSQLKTNPWSHPQAVPYDPKTSTFITKEQQEAKARDRLHRASHHHLTPNKGHHLHR